MVSDKILHVDRQWEVKAYHRPNLLALLEAQEPLDCLLGEEEGTSPCERGETRPFEVHLAVLDLRDVPRRNRPKVNPGLLRFPPALVDSIEVLLPEDSRHRDVHPELLVVGGVDRDDLEDDVCWATLYLPLYRDEAGVIQPVEGLVAELRLYDRDHVRDGDLPAVSL